MTRQTPVQALLFDLGGVLIDIDFERVFRAWAAHTTLPLDEIRKRFAADTAYQRHERGELDGPGYFAHLRRILALECTESVIEVGWNAVFVGEISDTLSLVRHARTALPCFCFTNTNAVHQQIWTAGYPEVVGLFDEIFVSSELGLRKPERRAFDTVAQRIGIDPAAILFFDDLAQNIDGAHAAGFQAVQVRGPHDVRAALVQTGLL
jgi:putative hydrolase of the HAD superfamily